MNIRVKRECAPRTIGWFEALQHNVHMATSYRKTFLREWRKHRNRTLIQVAEFLSMTHGQLSKIERGKQPYNQALLEALAELYMCDPVDLLIRDPKDPIGIWSVWDRAKPGDRRKIVSVAKTILDDSTEDDSKAA